jgi:tRNA(adenine34) deaminase
VSPSDPDRAEGRVAFRSVDAGFMARALELADRAAEAGEVPVGALVVRGGEVLGEGWNQPISAGDPTAHAEIVALRAAAARAANYRLPGATLYVTIEPCTMCTGALVHARIARLVYGAPEPRAGAVRSALRALDTPGLNHRVEVTDGVLAEAAATRMQQFFRDRRPGADASPSAAPSTEGERPAP